MRLRERKLEEGGLSSEAVQRLGRLCAGVLGLTRPVQEHLPAFRGEAEALVRQHHLLTHTCGICFSPETHDALSNDDLFVNAVVAGVR